MNKTRQKWVSFMTLGSSPRRVKEAWLIMRAMTVSRGLAQGATDVACLPAAEIMP
jgi:hypothetical protein